MIKDLNKEKLAKQLHEWYLEACQKPESGMDFNPNAQEPYEALKETQKFLDRYIAEKVLNLITQHQEEMVKAFGGCTNCYGKGYATTIQYAQEGMPDFGEDDGQRLKWKLPEMRFCNCARGRDLKKIITTLKSNKE